MHNNKQEVLIFTGTRISNILWNERDSMLSSYIPSGKEDFEEECWRIMLKVFLPEIFEEELNLENFHLRQIWAYHSFLELDFAESVFEKDLFTTIDPYSLRKSIIYN